MLKIKKGRSQNAGQKPLYNENTQRTVIHTAIKPPIAGKSEIIRHTKRHTRRKTDFSERLLRNTALACALLMGILALRNVDSPWSEAAVNGIETALTMRIDPDVSLGKLSFVRSVIPESTLVFFNVSSSGPAEPVEGEIEHDYMDGQPWYIYSCALDTVVRSTLAGTVSAVVEMDNGTWCVLIDHGEGVETVYACMAKPSVDAGDSVARGEEIGRTQDMNLYYEYRLNGKSVRAGEGGEE